MSYMYVLQMVFVVYGRAYVCARVCVCVHVRVCVCIPRRSALCTSFSDGWL